MTFSHITCAEIIEMTEFSATTGKAYKLRVRDYDPTNQRPITIVAWKDMAETIDRLKIKKGQFVNIEFKTQSKKDGMTEGKYFDSNTLTNIQYFVVPRVLLPDFPHKETTEKKISNADFIKGLEMS